MSIWLSRLQEERKLMRKERPPGFSAGPRKNKKGELDYKIWACKIPGPVGGPFEGGLYSVELHFTTAYPETPPSAIFTPALFHCNIYTNGSVCLDLLQDKWKPTMSIVTLLKGLQTLLNNPNIHSPANGEANKLYVKKRDQYNKRAKAQALQFKAD